MSLLSAARAVELLRTGARARVLVVGDLMLDRYVEGRVDRVSPEAPVPVVVVEGERDALGGAANVAANVTALGASCAVAGCVGDDEEGSRLLDALTAHGVDARAVVRDPTRPTTLKTRVHAKPQQVVRLDREADRELDERVSSGLAAAIEEAVDRCDAVVVQDYDKGVLTPSVIAATRSAAATAGVPLIVDPKRRSFFAYAGATVFKPNRRELEEALGERAQPSVPEWMEAVRSRLRCEHLLLTLGDRGMSLRTNDGELVQLPTAAQEVYDVSGAGDTVSAVVAAALAAGASVIEAAALANHAAAVEVQRPGVRTVTPEEVVAHVEAHPVRLDPQEEA